MSSIEALKLDFKSQITDLKNICNDRISEDLIFVGSGDSYVAGLMAEYATDHKCHCLSPSDLLRSRFSKDKVYCFISVTGKTKANIEVARRATFLGAKTVAVTLNRNSELAQICKETIPLNVTTKRSPTAGFRTFVPVVLTCLQLAGIDVPSKFVVWQKKGIKMSLNLIDSLELPKETICLLGNETLYSIALYASLKMSEFFCASAMAHKLEEFCHSPIFGIKQSDHIWIMGQKEEAISNRLNEMGLHLSYIELYRPDVLTKLFASIFFVQNLMILLAKKYGYSQIQYPLKQEVLKASSDIIYHGVK
jgi:fructoselysine-6-P-deglycase FrlB-like protein